MTKLAKQVEAEFAQVEKGVQEIVRKLSRKKRIKRGQLSSHHPNK
jgi:hypothetical protein